MHRTTCLALMSLAVASHAVILEAADETCGYLNGMKDNPFGCLHDNSTCAIYYPTSPITDAAMMPMITPAPQPSIVCYEPSRGNCTVQPTVCVDTPAKCTGDCPSDPMTLKCTTGLHNHCNRAHFESPLTFRHFEALGFDLRPTDAPANGWFCGPSAMAFQRTNVSQSRAVPMAHTSHSPASPTATLSVTVTLTKHGQVPGLPVSPTTTLDIVATSSKASLASSHLVSPTTTLSVTITLTKHGRGPKPSSMPSPPATVNIEDLDRPDDIAGSGERYADEWGTSKPRYYDTRRARFQRRQAMGGSSTFQLAAAASRHPLSTGSAILYTAYVGQTDRAPFVEATRSWGIVTPTVPIMTSLPSNMESNRLDRRARIALAVSLSFLGLLAVLIFLIWIIKPGPSQEQHPGQQQPRKHQDSLGLADTPYHSARRRDRYWQLAKKAPSLLDHIVGAIPSPEDHDADVSPPQFPEDYRDMRGQPDLALGGEPVPAHEEDPVSGGGHSESVLRSQPVPAYGGQQAPNVGRLLQPDSAVIARPSPLHHNNVVLSSIEIIDIEEDVEPTSEYSSEQDAYFSAMAVPRPMERSPVSRGRNPRPKWVQGSYLV